MAEQVLYSQASQRTFTQYISKRIRHAYAQSYNIHTHERKQEQQEAGLDIVSSHCHYTPKFRVNVNCILYLFCVNYLTTSFHQPHRYPLKIYIPTELSAENPAQYVCMHGHNSNPCINSRVLLEFYIAILLVKGG